MKIVRITFIITLISLFAASCTSILPDAHQIDIVQGNAIKADQLEKLRVGMTQKQVALLLGTPIIRDIFHKNRWDYVYSFKPGKGSAKVMRLTLYFDGNILSKIDNVNYVPES